MNTETRTNDHLYLSDHISSLNKICAMVADMRPALAQRASSKISLGRNRFDIGIRSFSRESGSSPLIGLYLKKF